MNTLISSICITGPALLEGRASVAFAFQHTGMRHWLTVDQARRIAISYLGKVAVNEDPQGEPDRRRSVRTLADLCTTYIENHAKIKRHGWKNDASCLRRRILPKLGIHLITSIVSADIEFIHSEIGARHPYAANHMLEVVRSMFPGSPTTRTSFAARSRASI